MPLFAQVPQPGSEEVVQFPLQPGLHLPGLGDIDVALRIRSQRTTDELRGRKQHRYGASFEQMAVADNALLQRYIFRLQQTARQPLSV